MHCLRRYLQIAANAANQVIRCDVIPGRHANDLTAAVQRGELQRPLRKALSSTSVTEADSGETASVLHSSDPWF
jgi:hypothetical protein